MKIIYTRSEMAAESSLAGSVIRGFVPTMGALHEGHLSLISKSKEVCDTTVVSIFVNPTQFNDPADLAKYPRTPEKDIEMLETVMGDNDILFMPVASDIYTGETPPAVDLVNLDRVMEGRFRPGHFDGVVRVVKILFDIVNPSKAFFGQKDFQQLTIIRAMTRQTHPAIEIVGCPVFREPGGLAMSSRNTRLSPETREKASIIYKTLTRYSSVSPGESIDKIIKTVIREINSTGEFSVEYFDIVDDQSLSSIKSVAEADPSLNYFGCIAVFAGEVRLIDNVQFSFPVGKG